MKKQYQSEALMVIHQDAEALYRQGVIDDKKMREFDRGCLVPPSAKTASNQNKNVPAFAGPRK